MATSKRITAVDLFCGAGGTSSGLRKACADLGLDLNLVAINHWPVAIETHARMFPNARHRCASVDAVNPRDEVPRGHVDLLIAWPECMQHSAARGNKPINDQKRASAWLVLRWLEHLRVDTLLVENVPKFMEWAPLNAHGRPMSNRRGEVFRAWIAAIQSLGYRVEYKILCAADYGDPTERYRLFVLARRGRGPIEWPEPTHGSSPTATLFRQVKPWRGSREIIDWNVPSRSIYGRDKPLSKKTLARIAEGIRRFGGQRFVLAQAGGGVARDIGQPLPTLTTDGAVRVVEPFLVTLRNNCGARSLDEPLDTITAGGNHQMLVEAFIASYYGTVNVRPVSDPLPTITTKDRFALVEPVVVNGQLLDIRSRFLQPHELARATSFDDGFAFAGTKTEQKAQIGNAVPVELARALCRAQLAPLARRFTRRDRKAAA